MIQTLKEKIKESLRSVLPITIIVVLLSITLAPLGSGVMTLFTFGAALLIIGVGLFTMGADMSMQPLGEGLGVFMSRFKTPVLPLIIAFVLGTLITIAEPDLRVLANQIPSVPDNVLIYSVAAGVGVFMTVAVLRARNSLSLSKLLLVFYAVVFILALFAPEDFIPAAFDSGGVTTGPITVPFIMALGSGLSAVKKQDKNGESSFGMVALSSIGPILSVLILSIVYKPEATTSETVITNVATTKEAFLLFLSSVPEYSKDVFSAILPLAGVFFVFQLITRRFKGRQIIRFIVGLLYTYIGLVMFLTGANVGFMPAGTLIGQELAGSANPTVLIPVGMVIGYFVVAAEPAVHVLKKQVSDVTNGAISEQAISIGLSIGVAISIGISMLRILTGISLFPFMVVGYAVSLGISFFVPKVYTGIAFDAGGVASGPMTTTFILPLAMGACTVLGGNLLTDAFGIVAMVAMTPLITIQCIGLFSRIQSQRAHAKFGHELEMIEVGISYYPDMEAETVMDVENESWDQLGIEEAQG